MVRANCVIAGTAATVLTLGLTWSPSVAADNSIGEVDFQASCEGSAQADFDHALGLMHHMMYVQARAAFEDIIETDPDCAVAYWGVATTLFQPLWGTRPSAEDLERGWRNIEQARERVDTDREEHLIEATAAFFREPEAADFATRIHRWVEGMEGSYNAYPDHPDIAALYSLSRLTLAQRVEDRDALFDEAEAVLRDIYEASPTHPGAIHYSIHATDVDGRAENALDMVEDYAKIAPEVPHALHMPSHIYVRLGDWPEVIEWNRHSSEAALEHQANGAISHHYIHAVDYLAYAHLQRGEDEMAEAVVEDALAKEPHQPTFVSAFHAASMPARLAVERRDWERARELEVRSPDYLPWDESPWAEGLTWYARGLGAAHTGELDAANEAEQHLKALRDSAKAAGDDSMAAYIEIDRLVLSGRIAFEQGESDRAVELTRAAAELEATTEKHPVTPGALLPPYEALGALFMDLDRPPEALEAYEASDSIWPRRYNTLMGAAQAAKAVGDAEAAGNYAKSLLAIAGESTRDAVREAREFAGE